LIQYSSTILEMLKVNDVDDEQSGLRIGAKTNNGLGKIQLIDEKLYDYDFTDYKNVILWLKGNLEGNQEKPARIDIKNVIPLQKNEIDLIIDAYLDLKTSLIQRSYNDDPSMPDASHIQSEEILIKPDGKEEVIKNNILTGSGTKGAITARAKRILNTIWTNDEQSKLKFIDKLFGYVNDPKDATDKREDKKPKKAKLQIEERELPAYVAELQSRIKIDRFTGGTINGALFDSMPLFNTKQVAQEIDLKKKYTRITIRVRDCSEAEAGLMLLVLKDLWTGDLPVGGEKGIGRGVFNGDSASIKFQNKTIMLKQGLNNLSELQKYVDALVKEAGGKKC
jgi:CRISPR/Cas system CSM-associated protein Csm3 (group 7 of RAMP superfamily)